MPLSVNILYQQQLISRPGVDQYQEVKTLLYPLQPKGVTCGQILVKVLWFRAAATVKCLT